MNDLPAKIPACAVNLLARKEWFADLTVFERVKLSKTTSVARLLSDPRVNRSDVSAITLRRTIYYRKLDRFDPHTPKGLALLAHEIKHVGQYERDGLARFNFNYIWAFLRRGYGRAIPYEAQAYALQYTVRDHLEREFAANAGLHNCKQMVLPHDPNTAFVKARPARFHIPM